MTSVCACTLVALYVVHDFPTLTVALHMCCGATDMRSAGWDAVVAVNHRDMYSRFREDMSPTVPACLRDSDDAVQCSNVILHCYTVTPLLTLVIAVLRNSVPFGPSHASRRADDHRGTPAAMVHRAIPHRLLLQEVQHASMRVFNVARSAETQMRRECMTDTTVNTHGCKSEPVRATKGDTVHRRHTQQHAHRYHTLRTRAHRPILSRSLHACACTRSSASPQSTTGLSTPMAAAIALLSQISCTITYLSY